jgi:hypothetical protein
MVSYSATRTGPPDNPARQDPPVPEAEADEASIARFDAWRSWLDDLRLAIGQGGGDAEDDPDSLLIGILDHFSDEIEISAKGAEERASKYARDVLRLAEDANHKIGAAMREQCKLREERVAEALALSQRLDRMAGEIETVARENTELRMKLTACEANLTRATAILEREISKERSLRRLLDSRRNRPSGQKVASELAKRHAEKMLKAAVGKKEEAA